MASPPRRPPVLVSACLVGVRCRFDGRDSSLPAALREELAGRALLAVCPEELGGLGTPRPAASFADGTGADALDGRARVVTESGEDVTDRFLEGARRAVALARAAGVEEALLKERSPSCGCAAVHREGVVVEGRGVAAEALARAGIRLRGVG